MSEIRTPADPDRAAAARADLPSHDRVWLAPPLPLHGDMPSVSFARPGRSSLSVGGQRGYSVVETLVVASLTMTLTGTAVVQVRAQRAAIQADNAMRLVMGELTRARDLAVSQRRNVQVTFVGANEVRLTRLEVPTGTTLLRRAVMEGNMGFALPAGTPDTSDAFGAGDALDFDGSGAVIFNSDGMLVDASGAVINGTVFLAAPNDPYATRAVTVLGATGRVRGFRRLNTTWGTV